MGRVWAVPLALLNWYRQCCSSRGEPFVLSFTGLLLIHTSCEVSVRNSSDLKFLKFGSCDPREV